MEFLKFTRQLIGTNAREKNKIQTTKPLNLSSTNSRLQNKKTKVTRKKPKQITHFLSSFWWETNFPHPLIGHTRAAHCQMFDTRHT